MEAQSNVLRAEAMISRLLIRGFLQGCGRALHFIAQRLSVELVIGDEKNASMSQHLRLEVQAETPAHENHHDRSFKQ